MKQFKHALQTIAIAVILAVTATACESHESDEYYIHYVVGITPGDDVSIEFGETYNRYEVVKGVSNESEIDHTVGPVWGGFPCRVKATVNGGQAPLFIRIEVSVNGAPYVTKTEVKDAVAANWTTPLEESK